MKTNKDTIIINLLKVKANHEGHLRFHLVQNAKKHAKMPVSIYDEFRK